MKIVKNPKDSYSLPKSGRKLDESLIEEERIALKERRLEKERKKKKVFLMTLVLFFISIPAYYFTFLFVCSIIDIDSTRNGLKKVILFSGVPIYGLSELWRRKFKLTHSQSVGAFLMGSCVSVMIIFLVNVSNS